MNLTSELTRVPVKYILRAAMFVVALAYSIAVIGAAGSYGTQVELLSKYELGLFAWIIPLTVDILAICAAIALSIPQLPDSDKKYVTRVLAIAVIVSVVANVAGGHNIVSRAGHAWPVIAYLLAEGIANRVRNFAARVRAAQDEAATAKQVETTQTPVHATATVKQQALTRKPGTAKAKILELAAATPQPSHDEIAAMTGSSKAWVKYVMNTNS
jgi:hypothetical protein